MSAFGFLNTPLSLISEVVDLGIFIETSSSRFLFCNGFILPFSCFSLVSVRVGLGLVDFEVGFVDVDVGLFNLPSEDTTGKEVFE